MTTSPPDSTVANPPLRAHLLNRRAALACLVGAFALAPTAWAKQPKAGDAFPSLADFGLEGTLPDLKGKVVLVDFWASWCGPCKQAFPVMAELHEKFSARGFAVVAVSLDEDKKDMDKFLEKQKPKVPFTVVRDPKEKLAKQVDVEALPTSFLLDGTGKVHAVHSGFYGDKTRKQYLEEVEGLLKAAGK